MRIYWNGVRRELSGEVIEAYQPVKDHNIFLVRMDNGKNMIVDERSVTRKKDNQ